MIELYSTNCPNCLILEKKLKEMNVEHAVIQNEEKVFEKASQFGIMEVPFMVVDGSLKNFRESVKYVTEKENM